MKYFIYMPIFGVFVPMYLTLVYGMTRHQIFPTIGALAGHILVQAVSWGLLVGAIQQ